MTKTLVYFLAFFLFSISGMHAQTTPKEDINTVLENWHAAAARADFEDYFKIMAFESVFIGTDPTENWQKEEFMLWSKPYFDKGKAWSFSTLERNIFTKEDSDIAWFDELLETHMGICRGSGVMSFENGEWKVKHYVLSIEIPNENVDEITLLKKEFDTQLMEKLKK